MDATCTIQDSIHVFSLVHKYVSRILGTYHCLLNAYCHFCFVIGFIFYIHKLLISALTIRLFRHPRWRKIYDLLHQARVL